MPAPSSTRLITLLLLLVGFAPALLTAQEAKPREKKPKTGDKDAQTTEVATNGIGAIGDMIPEGMKNLKVRIPGFEDGRATSLITADALTRQDKNTLFAEKMTIKIFGADPKEDVRVDTRTATYVLDSKILSSNERSRVSRSDFQLEGDSMVFDTTTSQGKMVGRVQMIIYDTTQFSQRPAQPATPPAPTPDGAPAAPATGTSPTPPVPGK